MANSPWTSGLVLALGLLLLIMLSRRTRQIAGRVKDIFSAQRRFADPTEANAGSDWAWVPQLACIGIVSLTLLLLDLLSIHQPSLRTTITATTPPSQLFGISLGIVAGLFLIKATAYAIINYTFFTPLQCRQWLSSYVFLTSAIATLTLPLFALHIYGSISTPILSFCLIFLYAGYEIMLYFKLLTNFQARNYGHVLIFLYFCTLEIAPTLALWKFCSAAMA